jgi:hypothetical protein
VWSDTGQILVEYWSNAEEFWQLISGMVQWFFNGGQMVHKRWSRMVDFGVCEDARSAWTAVFDGSGSRLFRHHVIDDSGSHRIHHHILYRSDPHPPRYHVPDAPSRTCLAALVDTVDRRREADVAVERAAAAAAEAVVAEAAGKVATIEALQELRLVRVRCQRGNLHLVYT